MILLLALLWWAVFSTCLAAGGVWPILGAPLAIALWAVYRLYRTMPPRPSSGNVYGVKELCPFCKGTGEYQLGGGRSTACRMHGR